MANKPFFIPQKEIRMIDSMNEELIDDIIGQTVDIYKVNVDRTNENMYGESSTKYYDKGFRVNCLIEYSDPDVLHEEYGTDVNANISMFFQRNNLASGSLNFFPEVS